MSITSQLPPKAERTAFTGSGATAASQTATASAQARSDTMHREVIAMTAALYRLKLLAEKLTPKTVYDWDAMTARDQERAIVLVSGLTRAVEALLAGSEE